MVRELLADERVLARRRRVDRDVPAGRARRRDHARDRRRLRPRREAPSLLRGGARSTCGARSGAAGRARSAGSRPTRGSRRTPRRAPSRPPDRTSESSVISATFSFFGIRYSARRNDMPWSVGAIRKTFGRLTGSISPSPPWYVTASGMSASRASCHEASTPVPSSTIATAPSAIARRTLRDRGARREAGVVALDPEACSVPPFASTAAFDAASSAPSAIVWPTYGVCENGALTAIVSVLLLSRAACFRRSRRRHGAERGENQCESCSRKPLPSQVGHLGLPRRRRPRRVCRTRSSGLLREPSPRRRRAGRSGGCARSRAARGRCRRSSSRSTAEAVELGGGRARRRLVQQQDARLRREGGGEHEQALLVGRQLDGRAIGVVQADRARARRAPSPRRAASSRRAFGVRNTVRNGAAVLDGGGPRRRARSGARSGRRRRPSPAACRRRPGARALRGRRRRARCP